MQCHNCRSQQPEGLAFCQYCGAPMSPAPPSSVAPTVAASQPPYGNPGSGANYNSPSVAPTVAASQPPYGNPGQDANYNNPSSIAPTVAAPQPPYGSPGPYTSYNPPSLPGSGQAYDAVQNPYAGAPYNPYAQPQSGNVPQYAPPPNNLPYTPPVQNNVAAYGVGTFASPTPVKPKRRGGLIAGIIIAVLVIIIVVIVAIPKSSHPATTTTTTTKGPSGNTPDSTVSSIVTTIQMASAVDTETLQPKTLATSFKKNTDFYTTFQFDFTSTDVSKQKPGYVEAKYYIQNRRILTSDPLKIDDSVAPNGLGYGYFTAVYYQATTAGSVELYWCRQSDCSDGKLAGTTTFTIY